MAEWTYMENDDESVRTDHDVWELASRGASEIEITEDTLAYETVVQVGPGGSYVGQDHTLERLRSGEHYYGGSFNRTGQAEDSQTMLARVHQRVVDIVSQPLIFRAPESAVKRIKQYVRDEARSLAVPPPSWTE